MLRGYTTTFSTRGVRSGRTPLDDLRFHSHALAGDVGPFDLGAEHIDDAFGAVREHGIDGGETGGDWASLHC